MADYLPPTYERTMYPMAEAAEVQVVDPTDYVTPEKWNKPPEVMLKYINEAAEDYAATPADAQDLKLLLLGVIRKESNFIRGSKGAKHGGNNKTYARSWAKYKDRKIPGSGITWGEKFVTPEAWRPYGYAQLNPYHMFGTPGGLKAGEPLEKMFDAKLQVRTAARLLATFRKKAPSWGAALARYNGSSAYRRMVANYIAEWKDANGLEQGAAIVGGRRCWAHILAPTTVGGGMGDDSQRREQDRDNAEAILALVNAVKARTKDKVALELLGRIASIVEG